MSMSSLDLADLKLRRSCFIGQNRGQVNQAVSDTDLQS